MPQYEHLIQTRTKTGEILEGALALIPPKRRNGYTMWIALNQESVDAICSDSLSGSDRRVLLALLGASDLDNRLLICQSDIGEKLGMPACNVSRSISNLVKQGFVVKEQKAGRFQLLTLHFQHFWKGNAKKHKEMMQSMIKDSMKQAMNQGDKNA